MPRIIARQGAFASPAATPLPEAARATLARLLGYRRWLVDGIAARRQPGHLELPWLGRLDCR